MIWRTNLIEQGKAAMMGVGETPWHKLGQELDKPAISAGAIRAARLDWQVAKGPAYIRGKTEYRPVSRRFAEVRTDVAEPVPFGNRG